jgi:phosphopantothenoylcysteine decarboxylase/phosphopantothenate--cysteine ligase
MAVLITAGATRNPLDAVRLLTASSSGRTGVGIARDLIARGVEVHLLGSAEACLRAPDIESEEYGSTRDLMARMEVWVRANPSGSVVHACAVGDYEMADTQTAKIPSGLDRLVLELTKTPKIADRIRSWGLRGDLVTFKAASPETTDDQLVQIASKQRTRTGSTRVFANVLGRLSHGVAIVSEQTEWFDERNAAVARLVEHLTATEEAAG